MSVNDIVVTVIAALRNTAVAVITVKGFGLLVGMMPLYRCKESLLHFQHGSVYTHYTWQLGSVTPDMAGIRSQRTEEEQAYDQPVFHCANIRN